MQGKEMVLELGVSNMAAGVHDDALIVVNLTDAAPSTDQFGASSSSRGTFRGHVVVDGDGMSLSFQGDLAYGGDPISQHVNGTLACWASAGLPKPGWKVFTDPDLGYAIKIPAVWFAFGRLGTPSDNFSNEEHGGAPLALSPAGVSFTVSRYANPCPPQPAASTGTVVLAHGANVVLTSALNFGVPGGEISSVSRAYVPMGGACYYFVFQAPSETPTLERAHDTLALIVASLETRSA